LAEHAATAEYMAADVFVFESVGTTVDVSITLSYFRGCHYACIKPWE
jgi:hypothetical protein